jgi:hypothetical protein
MGSIQGLYSTADFLDSQRPNDWREGMLLYYPSGKFPLTAMTSVMKKETCKDPSINWHEKEWTSRRFALGEDLDTTETAITVVSGALNCVAGTILLVEESGEILEVTTTPTVDTLLPAVTRSIGTVPGTEVLYAGSGVNPNISIIGTAHMEGVDTPDSVHIQPVARQNYTQIFRNSLKLTRTAQNTYLRTGEQVKECKREALENHGTDMEHAFFWGCKSENTSGAQPKRTTDGLVEVIRTLGSTDATTGNEKDFSGAAFTIALMEQWLQNVFRFGSDQKVCFCGNTFLMVINQAIRLTTAAQYQLTSTDRLYGMNFQRLLCPFGEVFLKPHPLFNAMAGGVNTTAYYSWAESGVFVDMDYMKYRPLRNSDTKYLANRQGNGIDGLTSEYLTECALEIGVAKAHSIWTGVRLAG